MKYRRLVLGSLITLCVAVFAIIAVYLWVLPSLVSASFVHDSVAKFLDKNYGVEYRIEEPKLRTGLNSRVSFSLKELSLKKKDLEIFNLSGIDTEVSLKKLFLHTIIIKKAVADNIYVNVQELISLFPAGEKKEQEPAKYNLDFFSALLGVKNCLIEYETPELGLKFDAKNLVIDRTKKRKFVHFDFDFEMNKAGEKILVSADDKNRIYMEDGALYVNKFPLDIDKSTVLINIYADRKKKYELNFASNKFNAGDIYSIVTSNILIPNGKELLKPINNVKGSVDFNLNISNNNIRGDVDVNQSTFEVVDLLNLPVKITQGFVDIDNKAIKLKDFKGYYNNNEENHFNFDGDIKDYMKTCDTKIISKVFVTNDFFKNYVSKMLGAPIELVGDAGSQLELTSVNGSLDVLWYFLLRENEGFKLGDQSMVLKDYKTLFKLDMGVDKNILKLKTIDYYITSELKKGMQPILSINGNIDMADNMKLLNLALKIPRPLPSEFLNFLACQKIFKKGTISGEMKIDNHGEVPVMQGEMSLDKVRIPAQRLFVKSGKLIAKDQNIAITADGRFKRSKYDFDGVILNELKLPIIVKDVNLTVDDIDVERMLAVPNAAQTSQEVLVTTEANEDENSSDDVPVFAKDLIIVEKCSFDLIKGKYKEVNFGNIHADLTLDKDGVLNIQSNKFDIADGISTLKVKADLLKNNYYLRLGVKDVNSDVMASAILGLPREISGKAKGLIELTTDESLKLNGDIKFNIENGCIEKVGYVEYILKVASLFRNPLAMISPTTFGDLVTIPGGEFDNIHGELKLKDNVIQRINIKSSAPMLSSFIAGRYDLESGDASLRIYTKLSNKGEGFAGVLRNISLNSLANRLSTSGRNDSNYYSSELSQLPPIDADEKDCQVFLTRVDGDVVNFNFLSSLKRIK